MGYPNFTPFVLWLLASVLMVLLGSCSLWSDNADPSRQKLFLPEYGFSSHGSKTIFDRIVEFDPGTFRVQVSPEYRTSPPKRIAVLPFTDTGSGNYVLDKIPVTVRKADQLADWRWTDSNRLRKSVEGYLAQREFETLNTLEVDAVLAAHGINDDIKLSRVSPKQLGRWLDVDAVVYGEVTHYEVYYFALFVGWQVTLRIKIVSTETGCVLFTGIGTRNKNEVTPALAIRDIAFNSTVNLTDLRDVDLRRAEEEVARELVWRIPLTTYARREMASLVETSQLPTDTSRIRNGSSGSDLLRSDQSDPAAHTEMQKRTLSSTACTPCNGNTQVGERDELHADIKKQTNDNSSENKQTRLPQSAQVSTSAEDTGLHQMERLLNLPPVVPRDPIAQLASASSTCMNPPGWGPETFASKPGHQEEFFRKEKKLFRHGRKTILDRLIETDPETFPIVVSQEYYENPPKRIAVLPFAYSHGNNLTVDLFPVTFHTGAAAERWRWTVGNRVRRVFIAFLAQREFEVVSPFEVDSVLASHGVRTFGDLVKVSPQELGRWLNVDAVVYGHVSRYDGYYIFLIGGWTVGLKIRMVSTSDGHELIKASGGRYAMIIRPAFVLVDIFLESGINLVESLRDIRLMRAEEETCREIVLRIPEVPKQIEQLQAQAIQKSRDHTGMGPICQRPSLPASPITEGGTVAHNR